MSFICNSCRAKLESEGYIEGVSVFCCNIDKDTQETYWIEQPWRKNSRR